MKAEIVGLYQDIKGFYSDMLPKLDAAMLVINQQKASRDINELVDLAYAMREIASYAEELRRQAGRVQDIAEKMACLIWIEDGEEHCKTNIKTEYATGTPQVKFMGRIPDKIKNPNEYRALMEFFEVPKTLYDGEESSAVKFNWPGLITAISNLLAEGKPVPPGIDSETLYPVYTMQIRKRKPIG